MLPGCGSVLLLEVHRADVTEGRVTPVRIEERPNVVVNGGLGLSRRRDRHGLPGPASSPRRLATTVAAGSMRRSHSETRPTARGQKSGRQFGSLRVDEGKLHRSPSRRRPPPFLGSPARGAGSSPRGAIAAAPRAPPCSARPASLARYRPLRGAPTGEAPIREVEVP